MNQTRIDFALDEFTVTCPKCHSGLVNVSGPTTTLVGFIGLDTNHKWRGCHCNKCGFEFMLESCGFNYWVSDLKRNVYRGIANCCGSEYNYIDKTLYEDVDLHQVNELFLELSQYIENTLSPQKLNKIYLYKGSVDRKRVRGHSK